MKKNALTESVEGLHRLLGDTGLTSRRVVKEGWSSTTAASNVIRAMEKFCLSKGKSAASNKFTGTDGKDYIFEIDEQDQPDGGIHGTIEGFTFHFSEPFIISGKGEIVKMPKFPIKSALEAAGLPIPARLGESFGYGGCYTKQEIEAAGFTLKRDGDLVWLVDKDGKVQYQATQVEGEDFDYFVTGVQAKPGDEIENPGPPKVEDVKATDASEMVLIERKLDVRPGTSLPTWAADKNHEEYRLNTMTPDALATRIFKIKDPIKLWAFATALADYGDPQHDDLASTAFDVLRDMGWDRSGRWVGARESLASETRTLMELWGAYENSGEEDEGEGTTSGGYDHYYVPTAGKGPTGKSWSGPKDSIRAGALVRIHSRGTDGITIQDKQGNSMFVGVKQVMPVDKDVPRLSPRRDARDFTAADYRAFSRVTGA